MNSSGGRLLIGATAVCCPCGYFEGSARPVNTTSAIR
jgi:hypothetical protein